MLVIVAAIMLRILGRECDNIIAAWYGKLMLSVYYKNPLRG